jgi:trimeric autotransporter adhesin
MLKLEATPAPGYKFTGWDGGISGSDNPVTFPLNSSLTVTAMFAPATHIVALGAIGSGSITPEAGRNIYTEGDVVNLTATANPGWKFDGWTGDVADPAATTTTVSVKSDEQITAQFSRVTHSLTIAVAGSGSATPEVGENPYIEGQVVNLTASPEKGWKFDGWTGDVASPASATTAVTMDADQQVTAGFSPITHTLTLNSSYGGGTPLTVGTYQYAEGATVDVGATLEKGWRFDSWSGDVTDYTSINTRVVMNSDETVTANFVRTGLSGGMIAIIAGAVAAALAVIFATRPKRNQAPREGSTPATGKS